MTLVRKCVIAVSIDLNLSALMKVESKFNESIELELISRGYGSIDGYAIIACDENVEKDICERVEIDSSEANSWDLVHYGRVIRTFRTNLEDAFQAYLELGN